MARAVLVFKEKEDDIIVNYDIASSNDERNRIAKTIFQVLAIYSLDLTLEEVNKSNYVIKGLKQVEYYNDVLSDIKEYYEDTYASKFTESFESE